MFLPLDFFLPVATIKKYFLHLSRLLCDVVQLMWMQSHIINKKTRLKNITTFLNNIRRYEQTLAHLHIVHKLQSP